MAPGFLTTGTAIQQRNGMADRVSTGSRSAPSPTASTRCELPELIDEIAAQAMRDRLAGSCRVGLCSTSIAWAQTSRDSVRLRSRSIRRAVRSGCAIPRPRRRRRHRHTDRECRRRSEGRDRARRRSGALEVSGRREHRREPLGDHAHRNWPLPAATCACQHEERGRPPKRWTPRSRVLGSVVSDPRRCRACASQARRRAR